jgi:hypothetical protein
MGYRDMSKNPTFKIRDESALRPAMEAVWRKVNEAIKGGPVIVTLSREGRTLSQNAKFHVLIQDIADQVTFFGNRRYSMEVWKSLLLDQFEQELKEQGTALTHPGSIVRSIDGKREVVVRASTTKLLKAEAIELIEYLYQQGTEMGVVFSDPALAIYAEYKEAQNAKTADVPE